MRVDFYQLGQAPPEGIIAALASKLIAEGQRLLVVAAEEATLARLDRILWDQGATSFLPHGVSGGVDDAAQPILLSSGTDAPNLARNMLIADGEWREAALGYDRAFYLFDDVTLEGARMAWKLLAGRDGVERNFWALEAGRWTKKA
ncbi:DNA polymerase III subunit chi [Sphingomonas sp. LY160]|uniref:DNA polymerase III subunit chi n=1 Tax=Sphingomonas sp. LY160 TaxID=3095342 RepID=UPI002ADEA838|nr:DNA polymerase III subunit chi [Sphingomonas sp. LY160]MEA1071335.1 DNA polymerase III subunit chi [Sphingomonas sp. LY160]